MRSEKHCLDLFYYYKRKKTEKSKSQAWKWTLVCMHATIKHVDVYLACAVALECICVFSFLMMLCCCSTPSIFVKFNVFFSTSSQFRQNCKFSQPQHIRRNSYLRIQLAPKMTNFAMSSCYDTSMRLWCLFIFSHQCDGANWWFPLVVEWLCDSFPLERRTGERENRSRQDFEWGNKG